MLLVIALALRHLFASSIHLASGFYTFKIGSLQPQQVQSHLYKLLLYDKGGHFAFHQDTEKHEGMFATLIIQLASTFRGGDYVVRNNGKEDRYEMAHKSYYGGKYVAHFADCEHCLEVVTGGHRLALVYSLCLPQVRS